MSIKILGGVARGFPLVTPKTETTRPTSVMVRRKLFDWRQNLEGHVFIDLFAGSGAMGLEALSRGASKVYLNDSHRRAFQALKQNSERLLQAFRLESSSVALSGLDAVKWVQREMSYQLTSGEKAIVYLDPPYEEHDLYGQVLAALKSLHFDGEIWLESDHLKGPKRQDLVAAFQSVIKVVEQGDHFVLVAKVI